MADSISRASKHCEELYLYRVFVGYRIVFRLTMMKGSFLPVYYEIYCYRSDSGCGRVLRVGDGLGPDVVECTTTSTSPTCSRLQLTPTTRPVIVYGLDLPVML